MTDKIVEPSVVSAPSATENIQQKSRQSSVVPLPSISLIDHMVVDGPISRKQMMNNKNKIFIIDNYHLSQQALYTQLTFLEKNHLIFTGANAHLFEISQQELHIASHCIGLQSLKTRILYDHDENMEDLRFPIAILDQHGNPKIFQELGAFIEEINKSQQKQDGQLLIEDMEKGRSISILVGKKDAEVQCWAGLQTQNFSQKSDFKPVKDEQFKEIKEKVTKLINVLNLEGLFLVNLNKASKTNLVSVSPVSPINHVNPILDGILKLNTIDYLHLQHFMIQAAKIRHQNQQKKYSIELNKDGNLGLFAKKTILLGQIIYRQENAMQNIVLADWIQNQYSRMQWGQLLTKEHQKWKPIKHSCNPNAMVQLSYVKAIRQTKEGQEITVNFMFFLYHDLQYSCKCGQPGCHQQISFKSQKQSWFRQIPQSYLHTWMRDYIFKETLVRMVNQNCGTIGIQYESGNCYSVANKDISAGQPVGNLSQLKLLKSNNRYSITKSQHQFWETTSDTIQFLNHKCRTYNLHICPSNTCMLARTNISKGEMLCFNYTSTEWDVSFPFSCLCEDQGCLGLIQGFNNLSSTEQQKMYESGHCSKYVTKQYELSKL